MSVKIIKTERKAREAGFEGRYTFVGEHFCDDFYLLDYIDNFSVISHRHSRERLTVGESFISLLGEDERAALKAYLYDESEGVLILATSRGSAIVDKRLTPSVQIVTVSFLCDEKRNGALCVLASAGACGNCATLDKYRDESRKRFSRALRDDLGITLLRMQKCFEVDYMAMLGERGEVSESFDACVGNTVKLCGCDAELFCEGGLSLDERFDFYAFEGFLISMLLLARRMSPARSAKIKLDSCFDGVLCEVSFSVERDLNVFSVPEIFTFFEFANRQNMRFEASSEKCILRVSFSPSRKDWSYLELKKPYGYDWRR